MTTEEKLQILRSLTDGEDSYETLNAYLTIAGRKIINKAYPFSQASVTEVPEQYEMLQIEIAQYLLNKRGAEGETAHTENGITRNYGSADVPSALMSQIVPHVGVIK